MHICVHFLQKNAATIENKEDLKYLVKMLDIPVYCKTKKKHLKKRKGMEFSLLVFFVCICIRLSDSTFFKFHWNEIS